MSTARCARDVVRERRRADISRSGRCYAVRVLTRRTRVRGKAQTTVPKSTRPSRRTPDGVITTQRRLQSERRDGGDSGGPTAAASDGTRRGRRRSVSEDRGRGRMTTSSSAVGPRADGTGRIVSRSITAEINVNAQLSQRRPSYTPLASTKNPFFFSLFIYLFFFFPNPTRVSF